MGDDGTGGITGVRKGRDAEVGRIAVLGPLIGLSGDDDRVIRVTLGLIRRWRERIGELAHAGLYEFAGRTRRATTRRDRAASCPPPFVDREPAGRPCRLAGLCPFCWAREAGRHWKNIDRAFRHAADLPDRRRTLSPRILESAAIPPEARAAAAAAIAAVRDPADERGKALLPPPIGGDLIELTHDLDFPRWREDPGSGRRTPPLLPRWLDHTTGDLRRRLFRYAWSSPGQFESLRVTPSEGGWRTSVSRLLVVPTGAGVPGYWDHALAGGGRVIHERPGRDAVRDAVARACRYPYALLTWGDAGAVVELLDAQRGHRIRMAGGAFSNSYRALLKRGDGGRHAAEASRRGRGSAGIAAWPCPVRPGRGGRDPSSAAADGLDAADSP